MMTEQQIRAMMEMFNNPVMKEYSAQYFKIAQQQGLEAAKKFWGAFNNGALPEADQMMERMAEFQAAFGVVSTAKFDEVNKENEKLKAENQLLRDSLNKLQQSFVAENGAKAQQAWQDIVDKQLEMSREATKSFFDVLTQQTPTKKGK